MLVLHGAWGVERTTGDAAFLLWAEDTTLAAAALREATEESGLAGLVVDPVPVHLSRHPVDFCNPRGRVHHLDVRYLAVVPAGAVPVVSEESLDIRWFPSDDLPTDEPDMHDLVRLARARLAPARRSTVRPRTPRG